VSQPTAPAELSSLTLADPPAAWRSLGFDVGEDGMALGGVCVNLGAPGAGIVGWRVNGVDAEIDGLPVGLPAGPATARAHPNGALGIDHVVVVTPDFDRTAAALADAGLPLRRIRNAPGGVRQGFRRLGPAILELVEAPQAPSGPARFWGLVVIVSDLEPLAARLGDRLGSIKDAVQPGRRIATLRSSAGLQQAVAFMDPEPPK
jgi:hypothetical protein